MQKKDRKQGKIGTSYREALMLPYKWRYTFSCLVLIVALGAWSGVWGQDGAETNVIQSGGFEEGSFLYWDQSSQTDSVLIQRVGPESAHGGVAIARLGGVPRASDSLDQFVGALGAYAGSATLSFYWKSDNAKPQDLLSVEFVDMGSGQAIPLASFRATAGTQGWAPVALRFTPQQLNLAPTSDYWLRFEVGSQSPRNSSTFDIDDVSLTYAPQTTASIAMLLPTDPPDPELPPPVVDEDGDMQFESTPNHSVEVLGSVHRDLPNQCSCGYQGGHQQLTLLATGYSSLDNDVKVKFVIQGTTTVKSATDVSVVPFGGGYKITCTVPDSPTKNYLGPARIKVKQHGEKGFTPNYGCDALGNETGFWYGFPDRIQATLLMQSSPTVSILGGEGAGFSITAPGLRTFQKWRKDLSQCAPLQANSPYVILPLIYAQAEENPYEGTAKVRVKRSNLLNFNCPRPSTHSSYWTGDGAPAVCSDSTPCLDVSAPATVVILNPDAFNPGVLDSQGMPALRGSDNPSIGRNLRPFMGVLTRTMTFALPPPPVFSGTGTGYLYANTVGYTDNGSQASDTAFHPVSGATNRKVFMGQNLYRIKALRTQGDTSCWTKKNYTMFGPIWQDPPDPTLGTTFTAWAPAHSAGAVVPLIATKDDGEAPPSRPAASFTYVPSIMTTSSTTNCLKNGTNCPQTYPANGDVHTLETFVVGPQDYDRLHVDVGACHAEQGSCSSFTPTFGKRDMGTDSQGRKTVQITASATSSSGTYSASVTYPITVQLDGYGVIEQRNINFYH